MDINSKAVNQSKSVKITTVNWFKSVHMNFNLNWLFPSITVRQREAAPESSHWSLRRYRLSTCCSCSWYSTNWTGVNNRWRNVPFAFTVGNTLHDLQQFSLVGS